MGRIDHMANILDFQQPRQPDWLSTVLGMFGQYGVDPAQNASGESAMQRLERIANELQGGRTVEHLQGSLQLQSNALSPEARRANQTVASEFNGPWGQLNRNLEQINRGRTRDVDATQRFAEGGRQAIGNVYQNLQSQLSQNNQATQGAFQSALGNIGQTYDQGAQVLQTARDSALADTNREAQSLGVQGAVVDPNAELRNAVTNLLGQQQTGRDNATSALQTLMTSQGAINDRAVTDAASEGAQAQDRHQVSQANALAQLLTQYGEQEFDVLGQLGDLESTRGARTGELLNQFQDQSFERSRQTTLDQLAEEISRGTLALQQRELGHSSLMDQNQFGLDLAQFGLDAGTRSLQDQLLEQEIGNYRQQFGIGTEGVNSYLASLDTGQPGPVSISRTARELFNQFQNGATTNGAAQGIDPFQMYEILLSQSANDPSLSPYMDHLRRMGEIYYGAV